MRRINKAINFDAGRVEFIKAVSQACKVSRRHSLYFKDFSTVKQNRYWLAIWLYCSRTGRPSRDQAVVKVCRCFHTCWITRFYNSSTFSNISSETTGPIKLKFNMDTPQDMGTKVCSNGPSHMTMMATAPIYGKNLLKIFFSRTSRQMTLGLFM